MKKEKKTVEAAATGGFKLAPPGGTRPGLLAPPTGERAHLASSAPAVVSQPTQGEPTSSTVFGFPSSKGSTISEAFDEFSSPFGSRCVIWLIFSIIMSL